MAGIRSLADLAARPTHSGVELIREVEPETHYVIAPPEHFFAGDVPHDHQPWADAFVSQVDAIAPAVSIYRIRECFVTPNAAVLTYSGAVIKESLYPYVRPADIGEAFKPFLVPTPDGPEDQMIVQIRNFSRLRHPVAFGRDHGEAGYFHWLHSVLPRAALLKSINLPEQKILVAMGARYQLDSIAMMGWPADQLINADGNTFICDELFFTTPMVIPDLERSGGFFERAQFANRVLRDHLVGLAERQISRRVFISRSGTAIRRLVNELEITASLKSLNFEIVTLENMPFAEQVELFASATIVVALHGAGLSNIAFMPAGSHVIEVLSPDRLWPTYRGVAARSQLRYCPYVGKAAGARRHNDSDISLDADHFTQFIRMVI